LRRRKLAAGDREIDLLFPFGASGMRRDVPNFDRAQGEGRDVGMSWFHIRAAQYQAESAN
jgi:hypothetical protein